MFFVVSAVGFVAISCPVFVFGASDEIATRMWGRREWAGAWLTLLVSGATYLAASAWAYERRRPFPDWKGVAAAVGAGLVVAMMNAATRRCMTRSGGRWIRGRNYSYSGDRTLLVAAIRGVSGVGMLFGAFVS
ncbi:MAG: hypothetical protein GY708_04755 [Actinomycetia bacterium]|nr:hypothetical protein [Actinomycetes bacterium]